MKVSVNWVKEYLDFDLPPIGELVDRIGTQLGAVDEVTDVGAMYKGVVIVKVVDCDKIENSDHLNVCKIDDGGSVKDIERDEHGLVQVVCGAPNVAAGVMVAWLPPGSAVPSSVREAEPFVLTARPLRGVLSNGMLASPKELAIGDNHEGLLLLGPEATVGADFAETYQLDDYIIDIENKMFTHRPDLFGQLGIAREIAGILEQPFTSPLSYTEAVSGIVSAPTPELTIVNEIPELVPRFVAQVFDNLTIGPSPIWLQTMLARVGIRPISNVVDVTNYIMMLTGQPLHAYDYDKVKALDPDADHASLVVRYPHTDEKLTLLNGKEIQPRPAAIVIATTSSAIGLGGVMGGANTEVDEHTTKIILECASFDMYSVRRTSMEHGIFSDAVTRFNKGQSPLQNLHVVAMAGALLTAQDGAQATAGTTIYDINALPEPVLTRNALYPAITLHPSFINDRLGLELSSTDMATLLKNVECQVIQTGDDLQIAAPFWRTDIEQREDIVEETGRLYGFDRLPLHLPLKDLTPALKSPLFELKAKLRSVLAAAGANEILTYSFVHGNLLDKVGQDKELAFKVGNALSPDLQYYRLSCTPSLLDKVHANNKAGYDPFVLFELGKAHATSEVDPDGLPMEFERLALVFAANNAKVADSYGSSAYYEARYYLDYLLKTFGLGSAFSLIPLHEASAGDHQLLKQMLAVFDPQRSAALMRGDMIVGVVGEYRRSITKALKLPKLCAGFEMFLSPFKHATSTHYATLSRFPKVTQDITLEVSAGTSYQTLERFVSEQLTTLQPPDSVPSLTLLDSFQDPENTATVRFTFRLVLTSYERTLTDVEVNALLDQLAAAAKSSLNAERI